MSDLHNLRVAVMGAAVQARHDLAVGHITWAELAGAIAARFAGRGVSDATLIAWVREAVPEPRPATTRTPEPQAAAPAAADLDQPLRAIIPVEQARIGAELVQTINARKLRIPPVTAAYPCCGEPALVPTGVLWSAVKDGGGWRDGDHHRG